PGRPNSAIAVNPITVAENSFPIDGCGFMGHRKTAQRRARTTYVPKIGTVERSSHRPYNPEMLRKASAQSNPRSESWVCRNHASPATTSRQTAIHFQV